MAAKDDKNKELWVGWTRDAISRYAIPDDVDSDEELINDMIDIATGYADAMLEECESRFDGGARRSRKRKPIDDEDD